MSEYSDERAFSVHDVDQAFHDIYCETCTGRVNIGSSYTDMVRSEIIRRLCTMLVLHDRLEGTQEKADSAAKRTVFCLSDIDTAFKDIQSQIAKGNLRLCRLMGRLMDELIYKLSAKLTVTFSVA